jgi:putative Mg2+ transporter-C (MgtC) family protein
MTGLVGFDGAQLIALAHIGLAMVLGGVIGYEREWQRKPAGLRTHMLVGGAAAFLVTLGEVIILPHDRPELVPAVRADPLRILSAVITGVSFLGAGTIIRRHGAEDHVEGLTTAASLLMASGIGTAVALAQTAVALGATAFVFVTLRALGGVERRIHGGS